MLKTALAVLTLFPTAAFAAPPRVISAVEGDFNGDGSRDRAVLTDNGNANADLAIFLNDGKHGYKAAGTAKAIAFNGGLSGNTPELRVTPTGSVQVYAENAAVGRAHWERTLTISYRGGRFVVSGLTASSSDALDPDAGSACDINLLTGKGMANDKKVTVKAGGIALGQWTEHKIPAPCR